MKYLKTFEDIIQISMKMETSTSLFQIAINNNDSILFEELLKYNDPNIFLKFDNVWYAVPLLLHIINNNKNKNINLELIDILFKYNPNVNIKVSDCPMFNFVITWCKGKNESDVLYVCKIIIEHGLNIFQKEGKYNNIIDYMLETSNVSKKIKNKIIDLFKNYSTDQYEKYLTIKNAEKYNL